ncbi:hypothetical protein SAMN02745174_02080 [Cetobacterium ceti]|uniref:Uncharacterized protein n=1 Tax=Cetobacterium ceti TaxID=180163 RepID=A0A1T4PWX1_9FUSO|nr:hypothetical protein [Cetobacterium ceti]SJZ95817.1 hypothetical protein SAMN02745174_02080 [Cetobacterium ceti]
MVSKYAPFYEEEISNILIDIRKLCNEESILFKIDFLERIKEVRFDYLKSDKRKEMIDVHIKNINISIKKRIMEMKIKD